ncbi:hypothetical protein Tco_0128184 [Tanacetum coccineum]
MAKLSPAGSINGDKSGPSYDSDILSEVPNYENPHGNDMFNMFVQELPDFKQPVSVNDTIETRRGRGIKSFDSGFARFNTIITSLKALDEGFSSKNYVRKFLRALHPKWRAKVTAIEESKYLSSLALDELISNLKVHEVFMEKDFKIYRGKKERIKSIALKAKKESSDDENFDIRRAMILTYDDGRMRL